eukprot:CAMPEP_0194112702 /NCGR_PEP_ID=MMETSP0150-20130528/12787_1 /TAXON_ID=122233 /ORGANISM="Chaetoceros debilis, Strain MM31A-1" /LENGTH=42 /DNA_ID= /DNA_START= /DNA_END= /DNA_ORIENTATION=
MNEFIYPYPFINPSISIHQRIRMRMNEAIYKSSSSSSGKGWA